MINALDRCTTLHINTASHSANAYALLMPSQIYHRGKVGVGNRLTTEHPHKSSAKFRGLGDLARVVITTHTYLIDRYQNVHENIVREHCAGFAGSKRHSSNPFRCPREATCVVS